MLITAVSVCLGQAADTSSLPKRVLQRTERYVHLGLLASRQACARAGMADRYRAERVGLYAATAAGGLSFAERAYPAYARGERLPPTAADRLCHNALAGVVSEDLGIHGGASTNATSCAAGLYALCSALDAIAAGRLDAALVVGSDAALSPATSGVFGAAGILSRSGQCRPFDPSRDGTVLAEGAAALTVEMPSAARRDVASRDCRREALCRIGGISLSSDGTGPYAPDPSGQHLAGAMDSALRQAGALPCAVGRVYAHATGTKAGDAAEEAALRLVFGNDFPRVLTPKEALGHTLAASGLVSVALAARFVQQRRLPALVNAVGFGGANASVCLVPF